MESHSSLYIKGSELSFRYTLFPEEDTLYNLDYLDSNSERHTQELAAVDLRNSNVPLLISSELHYMPAYTGHQHAFDTFHGQVISERPLVGRSCKPSHLRHLLAKKLTDHLTPVCEVFHENDYLSLWNRITSQWEASLYIDVNTENNLQMEVVVPSSEYLVQADRHDDARFASELWVLLHDFAVNLPVDLNASASALGRVAFSRRDAGQTLHIGIDRFSDACRLGMEALTQIEALRDMSPSQIITIANDLDISTWDLKLTHADDDTVRAICRRAATLAQTNKSILTNEIFGSSVAMHAQLRNLGVIQSE